jgi:hypothetical protein
LRGKRIALVEGYACGDGIVTSGVIPVRSTSEQDRLSLVLAGKADYVLMDEVVVRHPRALSQRGEDAAERRDDALVRRSLYLAGDRPDAASIVEALQCPAPRRDRRSCTCHRLLHVAWIVAASTAMASPSSSRRATCRARKGRRSRHARCSRASR